MTVVPFPPRTPVPARSLEDLVARKRTEHQACDIVVRKDDRTRRYHLWADAPGCWIGEVWYGDARHQRTRATGLLEAKQITLRYIRELRELRADGWTVTH